MSVGLLYGCVLASIDKKKTNKQIFCHTSRFFFTQKNKFFCVKIIVLFVFMIFVSIITVSSFVSFSPDLSADRLVCKKKDPFYLFVHHIPPVSSHIFISVVI